MNPMVSVTMALEALRANKLRSLLTMLGIIIGVTAVIAMVSIGRGAEKQVNEQISALGTNTLVVFPGGGRGGGPANTAGGGAPLTEDDAIALKKRLPELEAVAPLRQGSAQAIAANENWSTNVIGVTQDYFVARDLKITSGRSFTDREIRTAGKMALVGPTIVKNLYAGGDPLGSTLRVNKVPLLVIGVLEEKGQSFGGNDQDDVVIVPLATARNRILGARPNAAPRAIGNINLKVRDGYDMNDAQDAVKQILRERRRIKDGEEDGFNVRNLSEIANARASTSKILSGLLAAIASISLLVGGIGIMNIMLVSVTERTREIGLRMAVGARPRDVLNQFLIEALVLALIGGLIGVVLGLVIAVAVAQLAGWPIVVSPSVIALATIFSGGTGVAFGFYPALRASRLSPIEALRTD
jgi:putative ABC transport system permease protein